MLLRMPDTCKNVDGFVEEQPRPALDSCFEGKPSVATALISRHLVTKQATRRPPACFFRDIPHSVFPLISSSGLHATGAHNRL